jgi:hypothetical protein
MCADSKNTALDMGAVAGGEESLLLSSQGGTGGSQTRRWTAQSAANRSLKKWLRNGFDRPLGALRTVETGRCAALWHTSKLKTQYWHGFRPYYFPSRAQGRVVALVAPLFGVCRLSIRSWRPFVPVVAVRFSTALITSFSARSRSSHVPPGSQATKTANAATAPLVGFLASRYLPPTHHSPAPRSKAQR